MNYEEYLNYYNAPFEPGEGPRISPELWFNQHVGTGFQEGEVLAWLKRFGTPDQFMAFLTGWEHQRFGKAMVAGDYEKVIERSAYVAGYDAGTAHDA
jgi:hypothetical protein